MNEIAKIIKAMDRKPDTAESFYYHCCEVVEVSRVKNKELGYMMRKLRIAQSVTLRNHGKAMKFSAPYVSDLELGRRGWSVKMVRTYLEALPQMPQPPSLQIR